MKRSFSIKAKLINDELQYQGGGKQQQRWWHTPDLQGQQNQLSDWALSLWLGDWGRVRKCLSKLSEKEVSTLLRRRESLANFGALFHVILGAKAKAYYPENVHDLKSGHVRILKKLLSLGAEVNVHDVAGFTPLHIAGMFAGEVSAVIAKLLIEAGANVNVKNRFGEQPMIEFLQTDNIEVIRLLVDNKADMILTNHGGMNMRAESLAHSLNIRELLESALTAALGRARQEVEAQYMPGHNARQCRVCEHYRFTAACTEKEFRLGVHSPT